MKPAAGVTGITGIKKWVRTVAIVSAVASIAALSGCGSADQSGDGADDSGRNAGRGSVGAERNFATLINGYAKAKTTPTPWAGYWWAFTGNGIAAGTAGSTHSHASSSSPAGKYDAARGNVTRAQDWEVSNHGSKVKGIQGWWGHCNGWCAASALFPEPHGPVTVNGIEFGIADIKALLTEAGMEASADYFGERMEAWDGAESPKFYDTVPDQFFLVTTNYIGKKNQAVLIDRYTGDQVWNQPLAGYEFQYPKPADYLGADPAAPNTYRINVTATMWWEDDGVPPDVQTPDFDFQDGPTVASRQLTMELWLDGPVEFDANGKVVKSGNVIVTRSADGQTTAGGAWKMGSVWSDGWPDYMWIPYSILKPNADDPSANPYIDIEWIKKHILVPGGADDHTPGTRPSPIHSAPTPEPTHSHDESPTPTPTHPHPLPIPHPPNPFPHPNPNPPGPGH